MSGTASADAASIATRTPVHFRRIEQMTERLGRQPLRIERNLRGDIISADSSILNRMNQIYGISRRLDPHFERTEIGGLPHPDEQSGPNT